MSRTFGHKRDQYCGVKKAVKSGSKTFSRIDARMKIKRIINDPEKADEIVFYRFQDYDDRWNYD